MGAGGVAERLRREIRQHGLQHLGSDRSGGGVIQVDRRKHGWEDSGEMTGRERLSHFERSEKSSGLTSDMGAETARWAISCFARNDIQLLQALYPEPHDVLHFKCLMGEI